MRARFFFVLFAAAIFITSCMPKPLRKTQAEQAQQFLAAIAANSLDEAWDLSSESFKRKYGRVSFDNNCRKLASKLPKNIEALMILDEGSSQDAIGKKYVYYEFGTSSQQLTRFGIFFMEEEPELISGIYNQKAGQPRNLKLPN